MKRISEYEFNLDVSACRPIASNQGKTWTLSFPMRKYTLISIIAVGGFGIIFKCLNEQTKQFCAIKCTITQWFDPDAHLSAIREITMTTFASQADIGARLFDIGLITYTSEFDKYISAAMLEYSSAGFHTKFSAKTPIVVYVMKLYDTDMSEFLHKRGFSYENSLAGLDTYVSNWTVIERLYSRLKRMHENGIVHCDLKPNNIVCDIETTAKGEVITDMRVIDFGLSMFNNRSVEPLFQPESVRFRIYVMNKYVGNYGLKDVHAAKFEDVLDDKTKLDEWFLQSLQKSIKLRRKREQQPTGAYQILGMMFKLTKSLTSGPPTPSPASPERPTILALPWLTGHSLREFFPRLDSDVDRWFRAIARKLHPDKTAPLLQRLEQQNCDTEKCKEQINAIVKALYIAIQSTVDNIHKRNDWTIHNEFKELQSVEIILRNQVAREILAFIQFA